MESSPWAHSNRRSGRWSGNGLSSVNSGTDPNVLQDVLLEPSVGIVLNFMQYCVSFFIVLIPQLQIWHIHLMVAIQSVGGLHSQVTSVLNCLPQGDVTTNEGTR